MTKRKKSSSDENDITNREAGVTKKEKVILIDQTRNGYFFIKFGSGGELPRILKGHFLRYEEAQHQVDCYLASK